MIKTKTEFKQTEIGMVPVGWQVYSVKELKEKGAIIEFQDGNHGELYPRKHHFSESGRPFLTANLIQNGQVYVNEAPRLPEGYWKKLRIGFSRPGDVLLTHNATVGRVAVLPEQAGDCIVGTSVTYYRLDANRINNEYLAYFMLSSFFQNQLKAVMAQTTRDQVPITSQSNLLVVLPPIIEQKVIAKILSDLNNRIKLNQQMNKTLEGIGKAIFKQWFIDFEFPNEESKPYKSAGGAMTYNEELKKEIPKGWRLGHLADIAENPRRGILPNEVEQGTPYIGLEHMPRKSIALAEWDSSEKVSSNKFQFYRGEILFGKLRPYFHKVGIAPINGVCSTDILVITPKFQIYDGLLLLHISSEEFVKYADSAFTGTRMPRANWEYMSHYEILIPEDHVIETFNRTIMPFVERICTNVLQSRALGSIRDCLLPRLTSGKIRIPIGAQ